MANGNAEDSQGVYQNRGMNQQAPRFSNQNQANQGYRQNNYQKQVPFPSPNVFESMGSYQGGYNNGYQNGYNNQNGYAQRPYNSKYTTFTYNKKLLEMQMLMSNLTYSRYAKRAATISQQQQWWQQKQWHWIIIWITSASLCYPSALSTDASSSPGDAW